jgi:lysophospholipase L1-like esterase
VQWSLAKRGRYVALTALTAAGVVVAAGSPALAGPDWDQPGYGMSAHDGAYLALGDSVPFGFRGSQSPDVYANPANFVGYPELVAADLGLRVLNASCPGETIDSFRDAEAQSNGCNDRLNSEIGHRDLFPLHVDYEGSQLDHAVQTLQEEPRVRLVTLQLGANDAFLCQQITVDRCTSPASIQALAEHVRGNLDLVLTTLRDDGGYCGRIAVVTYYSLDYADPQLTAATQVLNAALTAAAVGNGATVADGFAAFAPRSLAAGGSPVAAGLVLPDDVHPTAEGQRLLADAVLQAVGH